MIAYITDKNQKAEIAKQILFDLPEWFGLPDSTQTYISESQNYPFWASYNHSNNPTGFIVLKETSRFTCEIYVMGVLKRNQHQGIGLELWENFCDYAKKNGYQYIQVKTIQSGNYKEYDLTNQFYQKLGFKELEVFPTLWDKWNPCQVYIQYIG